MEVAMDTEQSAFSPIKHHRLLVQTNVFWSHIFHIHLNNEKCVKWNQISWDKLHIFFIFWTVILSATTCFEEPILTRVSPNWEKKSLKESHSICKLWYVLNLSYMMNMIGMVDFKYSASIRVSTGYFDDECVYEYFISLSTSTNTVIGYLSITSTSTKYSGPYPGNISVEKWQILIKWIHLCMCSKNRFSRTMINTFRWRQNGRHL